MDPTSAKRPTESTQAESGHPPKVPRVGTPPPPADKGTEDVGAFMQTPAVTRIPSHCSLTEHGKNIYADGSTDCSRSSRSNKEESPMGHILFDIPSGPQRGRRSTGARHRFRAEY